MRIISDFKDYYDSAAAYGIDTTVIYQRKRTPLFVPELVSLFEDMPRNSDFGKYWAEMWLQVVVVAGKGYPLVTINEGRPGEKVISRWYDLEMLNRHIANHPKREFFQTRFGGWDGPDRGWSNHYAMSYAGLKVAFAKVRNMDLSHVCIDHCAPVALIVWDKRKIEPNLILNPNLSELRFQQVMDPYTAFQEIDMYLSGVLGQSANPMVAISDQDRIAKHGFDKWSFRKKVR